MRKSVIAIIVIVLVVLYMSVFVVKEGERGITLRFGKVLRDDDNKPLVYEPGLHFKIPFIETVKMLDARIQTMDNQADRFVTKEKKDLPTWLKGLAIAGLIFLFGFAIFFIWALAIGKAG